MFVFIFIMVWAFVIPLYVEKFVLLPVQIINSQLLELMSFALGTFNIEGFAREQYIAAFPDFIHFDDYLAYTLDTHSEFWKWVYVGLGIVIALLISRFGLAGMGIMRDAQERADQAGPTNIG